MIRVSEQTIKENIAFIVNACRRAVREAKDNQEQAEKAYKQAKDELTGVGRLLTGHREKRHQDQALADLKVFMTETRKKIKLLSEVAA